MHTQLIITNQSCLTNSRITISTFSVFSQENSVNTLIRTVNNGQFILIENLDELFDNIFNTILSRYIVKSLNGFKTIKQDVTMRVKP